MNRLRKLGSMKINSFKVIEFRYLSEGKKWEKKSLDNAIQYHFRRKLLNNMEIFLLLNDKRF
jgi:hypothetical protein